MIYILNLIMMFICITILTTFIWATRRHDDVLWWSLRFLLTHSLISVVYMTYEAVEAGFAMSIPLILIRAGFASLTLSLALLWFLLRSQSKRHRKERFNDRLQQIFKDTP